MLRSLHSIFLTILMFTASCQPPITPVNEEGGSTLTIGTTTQTNTFPNTTLPSNDGDSDANSGDLLPTIDTTATDESEEELIDSTPTELEKDIVNLKVQFADSEGGVIRQVITSTGTITSIDSILDNHNRINCGKDGGKCHTTYFAGTPIILKAPLNAQITKGSFTRHSTMIGWECNNQFIELPYTQKNVTISTLSGLTAEDFEIKLTIEEDMDCTPTYRLN